MGWDTSNFTKSQSWNVSNSSTSKSSNDEISLGKYVDFNAEYIPNDIKDTG